MWPSNRPAITIVGHVCIDHNVVDGVYRESWGSAVLYIAEYLANRHNIHPKLHARYGSDLSRFIDTSMFINRPSRNHPTLIYENIITGGVRLQSVANESWPAPKRVTATLAKILATTDILIIAPLLPDYSPSYIRQLCHALPSHAIKILLPQGYYRSVGTDGRIVVRPFKESAAILPMVDVLIQSDEDSPNAIVTAKEWADNHHNLTTVVTRNSQGVSAYTHDQSLSVPAIPVLPQDIVNPVGAGDVFSAELALWLHDNASLQDALTNAQQAAYRHVSGKNSDDSVRNIVQ